MKKLYSILFAALFLCCFGNAKAQTEATFYTSMGSFKIDLYDTLAPITVDSFIARVADKFYDGLIFHRVIDNFMIQGGDPLGNGTGNAGYTIPDEFHPTAKNIPKALAMANAGPNTGSCQFFINLVTNAHLDNKHTVFGLVSTGFTIVQNIGKVPTGANNKPVTDVKIDSIRITKFAATVNNVNNIAGISISPNPTSGKFEINLPDVFTQVVITNVSGQVIHSIEAKGVLKIDLSHEAKGIYLIHMSNPQGEADSKVLIQ